MKTSLYIPFSDFILNNVDGQKILYENLVQSGPAYKLIVHESPSWIKQKEELSLNKTIEIISAEQAEDYKKIGFKTAKRNKIPYPFSYLIGFGSFDEMHYDL